MVFRTSWLTPLSKSNWSLPPICLNGPDVVLCISHQKHTAPLTLSINIYENSLLERGIQILSEVALTLFKCFQGQCYGMFKVQSPMRVFALALNFTTLAWEVQCRFLLWLWTLQPWHGRGYLRVDASIFQSSKVQSHYFSGAVPQARMQHVVDFVVK